jgi:hypothetical protein
MYYHMETIVQTRGPLTAHSLSRLSGMSRSKVNAILYNDLRFVKTERSPLSHVNVRAVWTWSHTPVTRPVTRARINSNNKQVRRKAVKEAEQ